MTLPQMVHELGASEVLRAQGSAKVMGFRDAVVNEKRFFRKRLLSANICQKHKRKMDEEMQRDSMVSGEWGHDTFAWGIDEQQAIERDSSRQKLGLWLPHAHKLVSY